MPMSRWDTMFMIETVNMKDRVLTSGKAFKDGAESQLILPSVGSLNLDDISRSPIKLNSKAFERKNKRKTENQ